MQPAEGVGRSQKLYDGNVRLLEDILVLAAVAAQQHAPAAMGLGELATNLPEMRGLHVPATIKAEHRPIFTCINGGHHPFLWMPPFGLPLLIERLLLLRCASNLHLGVQFDGQGPTDELHPLTERLELAGEDRVTHAEAVESIGDAASIACGAEASDALKVSHWWLTILYI